MLERLFSTCQIADLLGTSEEAVADWISKGWLPVRDMPGEQVRISEKGLVQFLKGRGVDMEAIIAGIAPDDVGERLPETVSSPAITVPPEEPLAPRRGREQGRTAVSPVVAAEEVEHSESHPVDPAAQLAEAVLQNAVTGRVSHIHLDPCRDGLSLRVRIDGVLRDKPNFRSRLPEGLGPRLIAHFKTLADLEVGEITHPQTGRFRCNIGGGDVGFRLATYPTTCGERMVIHVPGREESILTLSQIGLGDDDLSLLRRLLSEPCGIIIIAGPHGSPKATMLRAMLAEVNTPGRNIIALESRGEIRLEGVSRCRVDRDKGFTAADALSAARDQDVDVIMLDDIPDRSTAAAAVEAAQGGTMVLTGIFARNPADAMEMMLESTKPWALASAMLAVIQNTGTETTFSAISPSGRLINIKHSLHPHT